MVRDLVIHAMQITLTLQLKTDNAFFFSSPFIFAETVQGSASY